ncbi:MAG TPA: beta-ketoacyl synthase N-terminal-like domain-containing protein [Bacteroidia bacterium]|nr:beta-ketoacyl synthase N-terminal-like domain-containing protein [Bacteroidia bacterium]
MKNVFVVADNIFSPLGATTVENVAALQAGRTGLRQHKNFMESSSDVFAALFSYEDEQNCIGGGDFTRFEKILATSIKHALTGSAVDITDPATILVISSTKGNISMLEDVQPPEDRNKAIALTASAKKIAKWFGHPNAPVVVSNACISGLAALLVAKRLIQIGKADHAIVAGADLITRFVQSGFESFQALSPEVCKPFDKHRRGINLGEAAATIVLSVNPGSYQPAVCISGGSVSNDANHISGPSRTGEELALAIRKALKEAVLQPAQIDFISAHGTATMYNDEMEAKAFGIAGVAAAPVNSLKGYFGHTLGAAGLVESAITLSSMRENRMYPTFGFQHHDVSAPVNVCDRMENKELNHTLKTASGFGGCNAALVFSKYEIR